MPHGHYNVADRCYYCDLCQAEGTTGQTFDTYEEVKHHCKTVHDLKRVRIHDADKDPQQRPPRRLDNYTADEVLALPSWEPNGTIHNRLRLIKEVDGERQIFTLKVTANSTDLAAELLLHPCNLPPNTTMSEHVLDTDPPEEVFPNIYHDLKARQSEFVYFQNSIEYDLITLGTAASFFPEIFRALPFFGFTSTGRGWGKSTATKVMVYGGYCGIWTTDPTKAGFFRLINDAGGIVGFDQIDDILRDAKRRSDLLAVVDSAHQKGVWIFRVNKDSYDIDFFDPFCIVVWNGTEAVPESLMSRTLIIPMMECRGQKRLKQLPVADDFREIRDRLYVWRLRNYEQVQHIYNQLLTYESLQLTDRYRDLFLPLLVMAHLVDEPLYQHILEYAQEFVKDRTITQHDAWTQTLVQLLPDHLGEPPVVNIRDQLNTVLSESGELATRKDGSQWAVSSQWVKKRLDALGFKRSPKRAQGRLHYFIDEDRVQHLQVIFGLVTPDISAETHQPHRVETVNVTKRPETPTEAKETDSENYQDSSEVSEVSEVSRTYQELTKTEKSSSTHTTQKELSTPSGPPIDHPQRLSTILYFIGELQNQNPNNLAEHVYLKRILLQLEWTNETINTDLQYLRDQGLILQPRPGVYQLVTPPK